jgi:hypothetical protein
LYEWLLFSSRSASFFFAISVHLEEKWKMTIKLVDSYAGIKSIPAQTAPSGSPGSGSKNEMTGILSPAMYKLDKHI